MPGRNEEAPAVTARKMAYQGIGPLVDQWLEIADKVMVIYGVITTVDENLSSAGMLYAGGGVDDLIYADIVPNVGERWRAFIFENGEKRLDAPVAVA